VSHTERKKKSPLVDLVAFFGIEVILVRTGFSLSWEKPIQQILHIIPLNILIKYVLESFSQDEYD